MTGIAKKFRYRKRQKEKNLSVGFAEGVLRGIVHTASRTGICTLISLLFGFLPFEVSPYPL